MGHFIESVDRDQAMLLTDHLDDYGEQVAAVRAIDAFTDSLSLSSLVFQSSPEAKGLTTLVC